MPFVFNPLSGQFDQTGAATTNASLITSGTLADARLSANVSLDNQDNNFSASQTFQGTNNTAPSQTAASGASLMTRNLVDERAWSHKTAYLNLALASTSASGGSSVSNYRGARLHSISSSAGASAISFLSFSLCHSCSSGGRAQVDFARRHIFQLNRLQYDGLALRSGHQMILQIGRASGSTSSAQLTSAGFGFLIATTTITPFVHNGSTVTSGAAASLGNNGRLILDFRPSTGVYLFGAVQAGEPTLLSSVTSNLPTGTTSPGYDQIELIDFDTGAGGASSSNIYSHFQVTVL